MNFNSLHALELTWIYKFQFIKNPLLDNFFLFFNFFDRQEFYFLLIPAIWYLCSPRWGLRLFYLTLLNSLLNGFFKEFFQEPRPSQLFPELGELSFTDYGFPSGAAQTAVLLPYLLIKQSNHL